MNITGKNLKGRGTKFFVNYSDLEVLPEDYLFQDRIFNKFITLHETSSSDLSGFYLNWETRSFGKESINELSGIRIVPFPLNQMAQTKLEPTDRIVSVDNKAKKSSHVKLFDFIHLVDVSCEQQRCFLGLDQSYDDLWLGLKIEGSNLLTHYRYNTWANLWEVNSSGVIFVFYLPQLIALFSFCLLVGFIVITLLKAFLITRGVALVHRSLYP